MRERATSCDSVVMIVMPGSILAGIGYVIGARRENLLHREVARVTSVTPASILIRSVFVQPVIMERFRVQARANAVFVNPARIIVTLLPVAAATMARIGLP